MEISLCIKSKNAANFFVLCKEDGFLSFFFLNEKYQTTFNKEKKLF